MEIFFQFAMSAATATLYQNLYMENYLASTVAKGLERKQVIIIRFFFN
jgi:hypothetical protein